MIKWFLWCTLLLAGVRASASVNGCFVAGGLNELHFGVYDPSNANAVKKKLDLRIQCDKPNPIKISFGPSQHSGEINTRKMQGWVNQGVPSVNYLRYNLYKYLSGTVLGQGMRLLWCRCQERVRGWSVFGPGSTLVSRWERGITKMVWWLH